jgi:hypothetical protein
MKEPTIQEVLALVTFERDANGSLVINDVFGYVSGSVLGAVNGDVGGNIGGHVFGNIEGNVFGIVGRDICGPVNGDVCGTIKGRYWQFVETPKEKAIRLIEEGRGEEAIQVLQDCE